MYDTGVKNFLRYYARPVHVATPTVIVEFTTIADWDGRTPASAVAITTLPMASRAPLATGGMCTLLIAS